MIPLKNVVRPVRVSRVGEELRLRDCEPGMLVDCNHWHFTSNNRGYLVVGFTERGYTLVKELDYLTDPPHDFMSNPKVTILAEGMAYDQT